jgi:LysR family transcriptional regulator, low CO2-responsive transcriptional regulator
MQTIGNTDMSFAQLKAFHAVAQQGGFSKAAIVLSLTQPAISDHVRKLEEAHGVQLFLRAARGVVLTETGRKLYAITERLFEAEAQASELLMKAETLEEGHLTIGADAAVHVLQHINRFKKEFPRIAVKLVAGNSADLISKLLTFAIDIAVTAEHPQNDSIGCFKLREDRLVVVAPRQTLLLKGSRVSLSAFADIPLILREPGSTTRRLLLEELQRRNLSPRNTIEVEGRETVVESVAQGLGVAVMSRGEISLDSRLHILEFSDWPVKMEEWLLFLSARSELHLIRSFLEIAKLRH